MVVTLTPSAKARARAKISLGHLWNATGVSGKATRRGFVLHRQALQESRVPRYARTARAKATAAGNAQARAAASTSSLEPNSLEKAKARRAAKDGAKVLAAQEAAKAKDGARARARCTVSTSSTTLSGLKGLTGPSHRAATQLSSPNSPSSHG